MSLLSTPSSPSLAHTEPSSQHLLSELAMVETEFRDPNRIKLLTTLKETLRNDQSPAVWAYLWLSDIDKLEKLVDDAQSSSFKGQATLDGAESHGKVVEKCEFINVYTFS